MTYRLLMSQFSNCEQLLHFKLVFNSNFFKMFHCGVYFSTNVAKCTDYAFFFISQSRVMILICVFLTLPYDQPSSILFMPHSSWMFSASLSRTFSKWGGITIWRDRHKKVETVRGLLTCLSEGSAHCSAPVCLPGSFQQVWGWRRPATGTAQCPAGLELHPHPSCTLSLAPPSSSLSAAGLHNTERNSMEAGT